MWNLVCPPILTHWKTIMPLPVTVKIDLVMVLVFQTMLALGSTLIILALLARDNNYSCSNILRR